MTEHSQGTDIADDGCAQVLPTATPNPLPWQCKCGAAEHPSDAKRCANGHTRGLLAVQHALRMDSLPPEFQHLQAELDDYTAASITDDGGASEVPARRRSLHEYRARLHRLVLQLDAAIELRGLFDKRGKLRVAWLQQLQSLINTAKGIDSLLGLERRSGPSAPLWTTSTARWTRETERATLLAEVRGSNQEKPEFLTSDERHERSARAMRDAVTLSNDIAVAQSMTEPGDLIDAIETAIVSENTERIRRLGPVVVKRLGELVLETGGSGNAPTALTTTYTQARVAFDEWRKKHPTPIARVRQIDKDLPFVRGPIDKAYVRSKEHFRIGRWAQSMSL